MKVIDTSKESLDIFTAGQFDLRKWEHYIDKAVPGAKELCLDGMRKCINAGFSWENDYLPILNAMICDEEKREQVLASFSKVTEQLDAKIIGIFHRNIDVDVILYLGLCNAAGRVTMIHGRRVILLGIEKIMELNWCDINSMTGLIIHELGHVYQAQYGVMDLQTDSVADQFLWQLFTEGVAMVFEQKVMGDPEYFHQGNCEWKNWCRQNIKLIKHSFVNDLKTMTHENQRYFGDWVRFYGYGDTGYYLGTVFVRYLLQYDEFDQIIQYRIHEVGKYFNSFVEIL